MTEIDELLWKINKTPSFLAEVDWCEETDWFDKGHINKIINGIEDDEVCNVVVECITEEWYLACECTTGDDVYALKDRDESFNHYWRFNPNSDILLSPLIDKIEDFLNRIIEQRKKNRARKERLKSLEKKAKPNAGLLSKFFHDKNSGVYVEAENNNYELNNEEKIIIALEQEKDCLNFFANEMQKRATRFENELQQKEEECKKLRNKLAVCNNMLTKRRRVEEVNNKEIRDEAIREFVQQLIIFAESYPSNQNDKAEVIKQALLVKEHNGFIPSSVLDEKWNERLMNLGRKEPPGLRVDKITANNLYDVHNNGEVNLK